MGVDRYWEAQAELQACPAKLAAANAKIVELEFELSALSAKMLLLRAAVEAFIETVNAAVRANRRGRGGQHVPFHGDFCSAPPSVMGRLEWWARNLGEHLPKEGM